MKIGILGGGQLARMLALAGYPLGLNFIFYEAKTDCCARFLGETIHGHYQDKPALQEFINKVDIITYENENIPAETINFLTAQKNIYPNPNILNYAQDRLLEKKLFNELGIKTVNYAAVNNKDELVQAAEKLNFPFILKTRRLGYDGKGQIKIVDAKQLDTIDIHDWQNNYIAEAFLPFDREISIIAARNSDGDIAYYDVCENEHHRGILHQTKNSPHDINSAKAQQYIKILLEKFNYTGILVIEFFEKDQQLIANEMAPRVHNSGHWTIEGSVCSQFENHLRAILNWPLGDPRSLNKATMTNIIGKYPDRSALLKQAGMHVHFYDKAEIPDRKIGHLTFIESVK